MTSTSKTPRRKAARPAKPPLPPERNRQPAHERSTKLDLLVKMLRRPKGASLPELAAATHWQPHSVRGALAGSLKKKGYAIVSDASGGERRYRIPSA